MSPLGSIAQPSPRTVATLSGVNVKGFKLVIKLAISFIPLISSGSKSSKAAAVKPATTVGGKPPILSEFNPPKASAGRLSN